MIANFAPLARDNFTIFILLPPFVPQFVASKASVVHRLSPDSDVFENMHANRFTTDDFEDKTFSVALKIIHTVRQFNNYVVHVCSVVVSDAFVTTSHVSSIGDAFSHAILDIFCPMARTARSRQLTTVPSPAL